MSRSLNEVWRQLQIQRQMEQQRQMQIQRQIEEERERARREYVIQNRMLEKTNTTVAAAAAAAAGAGGSGNRVTEPVITSTTGQAVLYYTNEGGVFSYFTYDFETANQSEIRTITTGTYQDIRPVTEGGFYLRFLDSDNSKNIFYFINLSGQELWTGQNNDGQTYDPEAFSRYISLYYETDTNWILVVLQKDGTVREYTFDNQIQGGGFAYDDVFNGGFIVKEIIGDINKYYLIKDDSDTPILMKEVDTVVDSLSVYQYAYSTKILTIKNLELFEVFSGVDGSLISSFDFSTISDDVSLNNFSFISSNGSFVNECFDNTNNQRLALFFSGASDNFDYKTASGDYNVNLDINEPKNYKSPGDYVNGSVLIHFYDPNSSSDSAGFDYNLDNLLLPIFATDESLRSYYTFSIDNGIFTDVDNGQLALIRKEDYIVTLLDPTPYGIYYFSDNGDENEIGNGGDDMYDQGNRLFTEVSQIPYTHTQLSNDYDQGMFESEFIMDGIIISGTSAEVFGASSSPSYFTNLYPGLFVMCARNTEVNEFSIQGNCGADNGGGNDTLNFEVATASSTYQVFVKRTFGAGDSSINQIIIVNAATSSGITQSIGAGTDDDLHRVEGLAAAGVNEIYYLLMSQSFGSKISDSLLDKIVKAFINISLNSVDMETLLANLNNKYNEVTDFLTKRKTEISILRFNRTGESSTIIPDALPRRISDDDRFGSRSLIQTNIRATNEAGYGWDDLSDVESRRYTSFYSANNNQIGNYVVGQKMVMKDTANEKYWAIEFTQWTQGDGGGGFAYTRQLIEGGTFSGEVIHFTHSNYTDLRDVIEEGVLEIFRGNNGPIYNAAIESESNGRNPEGTLWNSFYAKYYNTRLQNLIDESGALIASLATEGSDSNDWNGPTYKLIDDSSDYTYVTNLNDIFLQLGRRYTGDIEADSFSTETGIRSGVILMYTGVYHRIITSTVIGKEFVLTDSLDFWKIDNRYISTVGALIVTIDASETHYLFYDVNGDLISDKQISGSTTYAVTNEGKRLSIVYYAGDDIRKIIFFNGTSVTEYDTQSTNNISTTPNDWLWWS